MKSSLMKAWTFAFLLGGQIVPSSCTSYDNVTPYPEITVFLPDSWEEGIYGYVRGVNTNLYYLGIYAKINDSWYNLPNQSFPTTQIMQDGSWSCQLRLSSNDNLNEISIYLIPLGYLPPIMEGEQQMPLKLNLLAAVKKNIIF